MERKPMARNETRAGFFIRESPLKWPSVVGEFYLKFYVVQKGVSSFSKKHIRMDGCIPVA
jgi:hypothetical protein